ncbi:MAG: type II toxin-antitoxin system VapC family toxin [Chitinophagales bacterium]
MNTVLCDTDVIIELLKENNLVVAKIISIGYNNITITPITLAEIQLGEPDKISFQKTLKKLSPVPVIPLDAAISIRFTSLFEKYCLSHRPSIPDMLIAATAISYDIELFTLNTKDFRFIHGLKLMNHNIKPIRVRR